MSLAFGACLCSKARAMRYYNKPKDRMAAPNINQTNKKQEILVSGNEDLFIDEKHCKIIIKTHSKHPG